MTITLIGMQWGDEGKGKFIDYLSKDVDWVIRYAGGANAGHSIVHGDKKYAFHLLPTGILNPKTKVLLGPAMVVDPEGLQEEIKLLEENNISWEGRIFISDRVHLVLPSYKEEDARIEAQRKKNIGTTKKGIGIAYSKRALRTGIRIADIESIEDSEITNEADIMFIKKHTPFLKKIAVNHYSRLEKMNVDSKILFEGAQGAMLDLDIGAYPYVTSGPVGLNGVYTCGTPHAKIDDVIGVVKAYSTRVGEGPFPTEFTEEETEIRNFIQKEGNEVGTTTGRLRRCGYLDLVALRFACKISGVTTLSITHLDVLDSLDSIKICTEYTLNGKLCLYPPTALKEQEALQAVYKELEGWKTKTCELREWEELPQKMLDYIAAIESFVEISVKLVSIGPDRKQTIVKDTYLEDWMQTS